MGPALLSTLERRLLLGSGLGFRIGAGFLRHRNETLTLAAIHALAAVLRRLTLGSALAGIHARAMHGGGIRGECGGADSGSEQHGSSSSHGRARQFSDLHILYPQ
jgi:hypothetical protein